MGNAAAIAAAFPSGLPPGISGMNDRCTIIVSNVNPDVRFFLSLLLCYSLSFSFPETSLSYSSCLNRI